MFWNSLWKGDEGTVSSVMEYRERKQKIRKKRIVLIAAILVIVAVVIGAVQMIMERWKYKDYTVLDTTQQEDSMMSGHYMEFGDNVIKYGGDEVSLVNRQGTVLWDDPHSMENPQVETCKNYCVVYDQSGSTMMIYHQTGKVGEVQTGLPISKATIAGQGVCAVILEDGDATWINVYDKTGEEIVTAKTRIDSPGYPVDLSLSDDGLLLCVSYFCVKDNKPASYVAFYNFGNTGQNQMDNMVSGYTYIDTLIPEVDYVGNSYAIAFGDDGFVTYQGKQIPEEDITLKVEEDIRSVFHDENYIGMVFREEEEGNSYRIELYNKKGNKKWSVGTDVIYDQIKISHNQIILYNSDQFAIYTLKGHCRYRGTFEEGSIRNVIRKQGKHYMVITDGGVFTIKLK